MQGSTNSPVAYALSNATVRPAGLPAAAPAVLRSIHLQFQTGEIVALVGPSGSGKTTLLNVLALSQSTTEANAVKQFAVAPYRLAHKALHVLRKNHFYAPQTAPLPPRQRVINAVMAGALPYWGAWRSIRQWLFPSHAHVAFAALSAFDLGEKLYARVDTLSGGERQRVGLARALVAQQASQNSLQAWFLDEPLSALDPVLGEAALNVLLAKARESGVLVLASLHHVALARSHFDRIVGLKRGELVFDLPRAQVTDQMIDALYAGSSFIEKSSIESTDTVMPVLIRCS